MSQISRILVRRTSSKQGVARPRAVSTSSRRLFHSWSWRQRGPRAWLVAILIGLAVLAALLPVLLVDVGKHVHLQPGSLRSPFLAQHNQQTQQDEGPGITPDVIVLVAVEYLGHDKTTSDFVLLRTCLHSIRNQGRYRGDIVLLTSMQPAELHQHIHGHNVRRIATPRVDFVSRAWWMKSQLLNLLPPRYRTVLYLDSDVVVTRPLAPFFAAAPRLQEREIAIFLESHIRTGKIEREHHAGIILMQRGASEPCLAAWSDKMASLLPHNQAVHDVWGEDGDLMDDMDALDLLANEGREDCLFEYFPAQYLKFAADVWSFLPHRRPALVHVTRTARMRFSGLHGWLYKTLAYLLWGYRPIMG